MIEQMEFIQGWLDIQKLINVIHHISKLKKKVTWLYLLLQKNYLMKFNTHS